MSTPREVPTREQIGALLDEYAKAHQFHTECEREYDREECGADVLDQARAERDGIRDEIIAALDALTAEYEASARDAEKLALAELILGNFRYARCLRALLGEDSDGCECMGCVSRAYFAATDPARAATREEG